MVEWCRNLLGLKDDAEFLKVLKEIEEDRGAEWRKGGVDVVPFYSGERATGWRGNATGVVANLTRDSTRADFLRANMEGLALRLAAVVEKVRAAGGGAGGVIVASGGALDKNRALREMLADCTGMDVRCLAEGEASSRGVAILVGEALERDAGEGGGGGRKEGLEDCEVARPNEERARHYRVKRQVQERNIRAAEEGGVWDAL